MWFCVFAAFMCGGDDWSFVRATGWFVCVCGCARGGVPSMCVCHCAECGTKLPVPCWHMVLVCVDESADGVKDACVSVWLCVSARLLVSTCKRAEVIVLDVRLV